ncbi:MAG: glycosyltransferase family 4 protein [Methylocella sp.]
MEKRTIIFARFGSFSHTNESLYAQLIKRFPHHEVVDFCAKNAMLKRPSAVFTALMAEIFEYGPMIMADRGTRGLFFFLQPYFFSRSSSIFRETFLPLAEKIDVVVQTQAMFNAALPNIPLILYNDYALKCPGFHKKKPSASLVDLESTLYKRADAITVSSSYLHKTLVDCYGCDDAKISTVFIGSNIKAPTIDEDVDRYARQQICFVGIDWERKGGPVLLDAFLEIAGRFPKCQLAIAGCSPPVSHPRIRTFGKISREAVAAICRESSIFCLPSIVEPLGIAAIEATAYALPVVATRVGGLFETVENGVTGYLVPPNDPGSLADALAKLLANPADAQKMGFKGRDRNSSRFDWEIVGEKIAAIVRRTASIEG